MVHWGCNSTNAYRMVSMSLDFARPLLDLVQAEQRGRAEVVLTLICANTLENARTRSKIVKTINTSSLPALTGQTGYGDRSDRFYRERRENLKPRAREGPRRSSWI